MNVVLIAGSRFWTDPEPIKRALEGANLLLVGDCPKGADKLALEAALEAGIEPDVYVAHWELKGKPAGALRNRGMVARADALRNKGHNVRCFAFILTSRECRGTRNCISYIRRAALLLKIHEAE